VSGRYLIVNADDFGRTAGVNRGIQKAHEDGIVTSASLMVRWPAAEEAAAYARAHPELSTGLHLDLGEWTHAAGEWYQVDQGPATALDEALNEQLDRFRELVGRDPTHLDSHQHVHREEPVASLAQQLARDLGVPLRSFSEAVRYEGGFYGQTSTGDSDPEAISVERLVSLVTALPPGTTELGCHPGDPVDLESSYRAERAREVETLCDPRLREALDAAGIELRSFSEL
jgi:predicted glycoside hydrolase/deacetylase ChbG (UPF0249 family)